MPSYPSVLLLNARSICNKLDELRLLINNLSPYCIAITETWLNDCITDAFLDIQNYVLYRADRRGRSGGGVCLYLHVRMRSFLTDQFSLTGIESLSIRLPLVDVIVWCLYIPPKLSATQHHALYDSLIHHHDALLEKYPNSRFIFCGDFNNFATTDFQQNFLCINRVISPTRGKSQLDLIWISESLEGVYPNDAEVGPPLATSDHNSVLIRPRYETTREPSVTKLVFDFRESHLSNFLYRLSHLGFAEVYAAADVNEKCVAFYKTFYDALRSIPRRYIKLTKRDKPWITPVLKKMIEDRWIAYRTRNWPAFNLSLIHI